MKKSESISLIAFVLASAATYGLHYFFPSLDWYFLVPFFLVTWGGVYSSMLKDEANKRIVDRSREENKP